MQLIKGEKIQPAIEGALWSIDSETLEVTIHVEEMPPNLRELAGFPCLYGGIEEWIRENEGK